MFLFLSEKNQALFKIEIYTTPLSCMLLINNF